MGDGRGEGDGFGSCDCCAAAGFVLLLLLLLIREGLGLGLFLVGDGGVLAIPRGRENRVGGLVNKGKAVFAKGADEGSYLRELLEAGGLKSGLSRWEAVGNGLTLFFLMAASMHLKLSGFLSLAQTKTRFLPAGTAKGPMPAMTSHTTSPGWKRLMSRRCSVSSLLFQ